MDFIGLYNYNIFLVVIKIDEQVSEQVLWVWVYIVHLGTCAILSDL